MKKVKKCISLLLVMYMLISPLYVNALSFEEIKEQTIKIKENIKLNENTKFENVSLEINYDSLKNTDNIVNLLNESLENSKNAKETLTKVNTLIANIEEKNNELLNVDSKEEYNKLVKEVEEEILKVNELNKDAIKFNKVAEEKYIESLNLYNILYNLFNEKKIESDIIINDSLEYNKKKIEDLNLLLANINDLENNVAKLLDESNLVLDNASKEKDAAKLDVDNKLNEINEYINLNGEEEINELIEDNKNYLNSSILFDTTKSTLEVIDKKLKDLEKEIELLNNDLNFFEKQFEVFEKKVKDEEKKLDNLNKELEKIELELEENNDSSYLNKEIENANIVLEDLMKQNKDLENSKKVCSTYLDKIKKAMKNKKYVEVIRLLFENESSYGYVGKDFIIKSEKKYNSEFKLLDYIFVINNTDAVVDSYVYEVKDGVIYIYKQKLVHEQPIMSIEDEIIESKYSAVYNDKKYNVYTEGGSAGVKIGNYFYKLSYENGWKGKTSYLTKDCSWVYCTTKTVTKTIDLSVVLNEHYEDLENSEPINSEVATNRCEAIIKGSLEDEINNQRKVINLLNDKLDKAKELEKRLDKTNKEITKSNEKLDKAKKELSNIQNTLKNDKNMTYFEVKNEIETKKNEISANPSEQDMLYVTEIVNDINKGNVDIKDVIETINNLDTGIAYKRNIINLINNILEKQYKDSKQNLEEIVGENFEDVSKMVEELEPLLEKLVEADTNLIENKTKNEILKSNLNDKQNAKNELLKLIDEVNNNINGLNQLKENNNLDFLTESYNKLEEAYNNILQINEEEIKFDINEFIENENNNNQENNDDQENNNVNVDNNNGNQENNNGNQQNNNGNVENNNNNQQNNNNNNIENNNIIANNNINNAANNVIENENNNLDVEEETIDEIEELDIEENSAELEDEVTNKFDLEDKSIFNNLTNNIKGMTGFLVIPLGLFLFFLILFKRKKDEEEN